MANVTVYTMAHCPYCTMAKSLLEQRGIPFDEVFLDRMKEPEKFEELKNRTGMRTLPQIFNGDELIGGYTELAGVDQKDKLESLKG